MKTDLSADYADGYRDVQIVIADNGVETARKWRHSLAMAEIDEVPPDYMLGVLDGLDDYEQRRG